MYTNTAVCLGQLKVAIEHWLDSSDNIKRRGGDYYQRGYKPRGKKLSDKKSCIVEDYVKVINQNEFYPWILRATASSNGPGCD